MEKKKVFKYYEEDAPLGNLDGKTIGELIIYLADYPSDAEIDFESREYYTEYSISTYELESDEQFDARVNKNSINEKRAKDNRYNQFLELKAEFE